MAHGHICLTVTKIYEAMMKQTKQTSILLNKKNVEDEGSPPVAARANWDFNNFLTSKSAGNRNARYPLM